MISSAAEKRLEMLRMRTQTDLWDNTVLPVLREKDGDDTKQTDNICNMGDS